MPAVAVDDKRRPRAVIADDGAGAIGTHRDLRQLVNRMFDVRRDARLWLIAILITVVACAPGSLAENAPVPCAARLSCLDRRLPAPITIAADSVLGGLSYRIGRDGRVRRIPEVRISDRRGTDMFSASGTWFMLRGRHLIVGLGRKPLWRSRGEFTSPGQLGVIIASPYGVAFQHDHRLYLARLRGAERPVASREMPLGWTSGGLYTYRYQSRRLLLRSETGRLLRTIARGPLGSDYLVTEGRLYFIVHGVLMSARGPRIQRLASVASLRMSDPWLQPVGRLLELQDNNRLVVMRRDGSVFAWTLLPRDGTQPESPSSSLVAAPDSSAVAFTAAAGQSTDPNLARRADGIETAYLLRAGTHTATPVHTEQVTFRPCERGASLQWRGRWLLYSNSEGNLAAIDTTGIHRAIDLTSRVRNLPGTRHGFVANWSDRPLEL